MTDKTDPGQALIRMAGVGFGYGSGERLLENVSLDVPAGTGLAILGPNGSGKTTMLKLMAGLLRPEGGQVVTCGLDPFRGDRAVLARRMAVVSAQIHIGFSYSVEEVVLMGRAPYLRGFRLESKDDLEQAAAAMAAMDVSHLASRDFDSLSSGEKQRAAVARALAQKPQLLLLDEPGAFLDIKHQVELYDLMARLIAEEGLTVVSVLHDLNLASLYFDRVALLKHGNLFAVGPPEEVITYANIREVFETDVYVDRNDLTGRLNVLPLPLSAQSKHRGD